MKTILYVARVTPEVLALWADRMSISTPEDVHASFRKKHTSWFLWVVGCVIIVCISFLLSLWLLYFVTVYSLFLYLMFADGLHESFLASMDEWRTETDLDPEKLLGVQDFEAGAKARLVQLAADMKVYADMMDKSRSRLGLAYFGKCLIDSSDEFKRVHELFTEAGLTTEPMTNFVSDELYASPVEEEADVDSA